MQSATLGERVVPKIGAPTVFHAFILAIQLAGRKPEFGHQKIIQSYNLTINSKVLHPRKTMMTMEKYASEDVSRIETGDFPLTS